MKKNMGLIVLAVILSLLVVGLGGFIIYDKVLSVDSETNNDVVDNGNNHNDQENNSTDNTKLTESDAMNVVKSVMKASFDYIYALSPECGERNKDDSFQENYSTYEVSTTYKTVAELEAYLYTFLSDNVINYVEGKYSTVMYKEENNKLYCLNSGKGCGYIYNDNDTNYTIESITNNEITGNGNMFYDTCGNVKDNIPVNFVLKKDNNNNWILDVFLTEHIQIK